MFEHLARCFPWRCARRGVNYPPAPAPRELFGSSPPPPVLLCARPGADNDSTTTPGRRASTAKPASGKRRRSSTGKGRKPAAQRVPKPIFHVLGRLCEIFGLLAQLFEIQKMPDPVVLQGTSMAIATFFEDAALAELQHPALALIRAVFSCYPTHRMVMVDDILVLLGKLPTEKRNLRNYRLQGGGMVQMVSAMFLVLVQNCIVVPERSVDEGGEDAALQKVNPFPPPPVRLLPVRVLEPPAPPADSSL